MRSSEKTTGLLDIGVFDDRSSMAPSQKRWSKSGIFPKSRDAAPVLLPTENTTLRRSIDQWFEAAGVRPEVVGQFEDSALLMVFGFRGVGLFPATSVIAAEVMRQYKVSRVGRFRDIRERLYAVTVQRRINHPAVMAGCRAARTQLFVA